MANVVPDREDTCDGRAHAYEGVQSGRAWARVACSSPSKRVWWDRAPREAGTMTVPASLTHDCRAAKPIGTQTPAPAVLDAHPPPLQGSCEDGARIAHPGQRE